GLPVQHGGEHAHVVGGGLLDDLAAGREPRAAEDVTAAHDDEQLHAAVVDALGLAGDVERLVYRDAAARFALEAERLSAQLEDDALVPGRQGLWHGGPSW